MELNRIIVLAFCLLSMVGCSSTSKRKHIELQKLVREHKFQEGLALVEGRDFYNDKESQLLKYMEIGMLHGLNQNHYQALDFFNKAKKLSDRLYTVSISKKALSVVSNDNEDNYYGEKYERSMIRFYQAMQHFLLSQIGKYEAHNIQEKNKNGEVKNVLVPVKILTEKEKKFHLSAARSVLIEWNSLLDSYKSSSRGKPTYKDDLLAKVFGAFVHEQFGTSQDRQIAKNLYLAAQKILFQNFSIYKTYNNKDEKFSKDFKKLSSMRTSSVRSTYLDRTQYYKNLESFINERLTALKKNRVDNVFFLISNGFIAPKVAKIFDIPLPLTSASIALSKRKGFLTFSTNILTVGRGSVPKIYFELPAINFNLSKKESFVAIYDESGKEILRKKTALVNPLSEIAYKTLEEESTSQAVKTGARVAGKHLVALGAAYLIYDTQKKELGDMLALLAASLAYSSSNKLIERTEGADLRFWSTLPSDYRVTSMTLRPGSYSVKVISIGEDGKDIIRAVSVIEVESKKNKFVPINSI